MLADLKREKNYLDFVLGYLTSAEICAEAFLISRVSRSTKYANYLFIPAIYNLKHAFEIIGKFLLARKLRIPPDQIKNYGHDFDKIINDFAKKHYTKSNKDIVKLKALFNKYSTMPAINLCLKEMRVKRPTRDPRNQFFHYPEGNKCHRDIFYYGLVTAPKSSMVSFMEELKTDVHEINKTFANIIHS